MDVRRTEVDVTGARISVAEWLPPDDQVGTVMLLHGGGLDNAELSWGQVGPALAAAGYRVFAPDLPGFGASEPACWRATQSQFVACVGEVVDALRLTDYVVGGLSLGGGLTLGHMLARPGDARAAVLFGTYGVMPRLTGDAFGAVSQAATCALLRTGLLGRLSRRYVRGTRGIDRTMRAALRTPAARTPAMSAKLRAAAAGPALQVFEQWQLDEVGWTRLRTDYRTRLPSITTPVLLVHGENDGAVPIGAARAAARDLANGRLLTVPDAGHWVQRDRPEVVVPAVRDFLRSVA